MSVATVPGVFTHPPSVSAIAIAGGGIALGIVIFFAVQYREEQAPKWHLAAQIALTAVLLLLLTWRHGVASEILVPAGFTVAAVPLALLDLRTGRLPNWLVLVAYLLTTAALFIATLADFHAEPLVGALSGAAAFGLFYAALYLFLPGQMGGGDLKLSVVAGAVLGWQSWRTVVAGLLLIWLLGAVAHLLARITAGQRPSVVLRHGPFLVLGTVTAVLLQP